ncbi:MAG: TetR/AcrR family transcriptional regulator [Bacteroidota bacterium]
MEETKKKVLQAADELFMRYGIRSVSMDDIAHHIGISKKTVYSAYADKDDLVKAVYHLHHGAWQSEISVISGNASDAIEELLMLSEHLRSKMGSMNPNVMYDLKKFHRAVWDEWTEYNGKVVKGMVCDTLNRGIREGVFRPEINVEILATLRMQQVEIGFNEQVFPPRDFRPDAVQVQLFDHFIYGLLTPEGMISYQSRKQKLPETTQK